MANLKEKILGSVSGKLGDMIFRNVKGNNIISVKPASVNVATDPASIARRAKFTLAARLSFAISANTKVKLLWKPLTNGLTVHNFLVKVNYFYVSPDTPGNFINIVPSGGFPLSIDSVDISPERVRIDTNALGENTGIDRDIEQKVQIVSVLFSSNPAAENIPPYSFITLTSDMVETSLSEQLSFTSPLNGSETLLFNQYQDHKVYFALVTLNNVNTIVRHSISLSS